MILDERKKQKKMIDFDQSKVTAVFEVVLSAFRFKIFFVHGFIFCICAPKMW